MGGRTSATEGESPRARLTESATDYVLEHGLIGLSLRPLAAALGTSDRMLIYHFGSKDELVAAVLRTSNERSTVHVDGLPPSAGARAAITDLWAAMTSPTIDRCQRLYVEAAALRLFGKEPYASVVRDLNEVWVGAVVRHLVRSGVEEPAARRVAVVIDAAYAGLHLDMPLDDRREAIEREQAVADLATALSSLAAPPVGPRHVS